MSVDSGLSAPVDRGVEADTPASTSPAREPLIGRARPRKGSRGSDRADVLADAVSTPAFRSGRGRPRRQGRRVRRVVRRIELWSVLKIALVFNTVMLGVALVSVALLWGLANTTGVVDDLEGFLRESGFSDFRFDGGQMFQQVAFIGAVMALSFSVFVVLATALINLISEITGGVRFVVIEEIVEEPARVATPAPVRPAPARPTPVMPDRLPAPSPFPTLAAPMPVVGPSGGDLSPAPTTAASGNGPPIGSPGSSPARPSSRTARPHPGGPGQASAPTS